jgi:iron complex transport system ATP-binding protein
VFSLLPPLSQGRTLLFLVSVMTGIDQSIPAYRVHQLGFQYRREASEAQSWSLRGMTFQVAQGEILGIIGPNGSGKTSLLKLLAKMLRPDEGSIQLWNQELHTLPQKTIARSVAFVPQEPAHLFPFTSFEIVLMGRFPHRRQTTFGAFGWEDEEDLQVAEQAMSTMGVLHLAHRSVGEVSSGERQRVLIARALAQNPRVLLLDEPTAFLDLNHQVEICTVLHQMNQNSGLTVVWVSHDLNLASQYCDRLLLLNQGALFKMGPPVEVIQPDTIETVYGCQVLVDRHPMSGVPRVTLPSAAFDVRMSNQH